MKVLVITNLFPNNKEPTRGIYNKQQFSELSKLCELKVVAPIPWSPPIKVNKNWYRFSQIPKRETIDGIDVYHPRYFMIPKVGRSLYGISFFLSLVGKIKKIYKNFKFDLIFATWAYPDGFGSFLLSKVFKKTIVIKVHGTDINEVTKYFLRRKMIVYTLNRAHKVIAVSKALKEGMIKIGVKEEKINVVYNGVDRSIFFPIKKEIAKCQFGLKENKKQVLFVGNLKPVKGLKYLIEALSLLFKKGIEIHLHIIGGGFLKSSLEKMAISSGVNRYIHFEGKKDHKDIALWMNASDLLCLPSLSEGVPNVILEALSCGTPVVASKVGGIPEIVISDRLGILVSPKDIESLAASLESALNKQWDRGEISNYSARFSWDKSAKEIYASIEATIKEAHVFR